MRLEFHDSLREIVDAHDAVIEHQHTGIAGLGLAVSLIVVHHLDAGTKVRHAAIIDL